MNLQVADLGNTPSMSLGGYVPAAQQKRPGTTDQLLQAFLGGALGSIGSEIGSNIMANDVSAEAAKEGLRPEGEQGAFKRWFSPYTKEDLKADRAGARDDMRMGMDRAKEMNDVQFRNKSLKLQERQIDETTNQRKTQNEIEGKRLGLTEKQIADEWAFKSAAAKNDALNTDVRFNLDREKLAEDARQANMKVSVALGHKLEDLGLNGLPKPVVVPQQVTPPVDHVAAAAALEAAKQGEPQSRLALEVANLPTALKNWVNPPGTPADPFGVQNPIRAMPNLAGYTAGKAAEGYNYMMSPPPEQLRGAKYKSPEQLLAEFANLSQKLPPEQAAQIEARLRAAAGTPTDYQFVPRK